MLLIISSQELPANRGTKVHHMCEDYLNNNFDEDKHKKDFLAYCLFGQLKNQSLKNIDNIHFQEVASRILRQI